jgi:hypothetical protein
VRRSSRACSAAGSAAAGDEQPRLRQHLRDLGPRLGVGGAALAMWIAVVAAAACLAAWTS